MSDSPPTPAKAKPPVNPLLAVFNFFTSLKLAVVVLGLSAVLVFLGTLAQVNEGLYQAQARWFKQWIVIRHDGDPLWVWIYPGGYLLGVLLLVNLMGAHLRRFKFPPGGWPVLLLHYSLVMAALFFITYGLLWSPWMFFMACTVLLVLDLVLSSADIGWKPMVGTGRKIGVDLTHFGIVVLMVGQLATDMLAVETHLALRKGETRHYTQKYTDMELVFARDIPGDTQNEDIVAIPETLMVKKDAPIGERLSHEKLPFKVRLTEWQGNSELVDLNDAAESEGRLRQALATLEATYATPDGLISEAKRALEVPGRIPVWVSALREVGEKPGEDIVPAVESVQKQPEKAAALLGKLKAGFRKEMLGMFKQQDASMRFAALRVEEDHPITEASPGRQASTPVAQRYYTRELPILRDMESQNYPSAVIELSGPDGSLGTWLVSPQLREQKVMFEGKEWRVSLRIERTYHPFAVTLLKTTHEVYAGTDEPRDFRSRVRIVNPGKNEDREAEIYMNTPLRYEGLTFFQSQMSSRQEIKESGGSSSLQVVRNPSWFSPYFGCALVGYGMARHFLLHLFRFIRRKPTT